MQTAKKIESDSTAIVIDFKTQKRVKQKLDTVENEKGEKSCFRTNHRYYCNDTDCACWSDCQKLVASWLRY